MAYHIGIPHRLQVSGYYGGPLLPNKRTALAELRRIVADELRACRRKYGRAFRRTVSLPGGPVWVEITPNNPRRVPDHLRTLWLSVSATPEPRATHGARI